MKTKVYSGGFERPGMVGIQHRELVYGTQKTLKVLDAGGSMYSSFWEHEDNDTMESLGRYDTQVFEDTLASFGSVLFCLLVFVVLSSVVGLVYLEIKNGLYLERLLLHVSGLYRSGSRGLLGAQDGWGEGKPADLANLAIPRHIAVIMDGNRRYGKENYGMATKGHADGGETLSKCITWCKELGVEALTVYAFSTENWNRSQHEIDYLMSVFEKYSNKILEDALENNVKVSVLASEKELLPLHIQQLFDALEEKTKGCNSFHLNLCVSYGGRSEIVQAAKSLAADVQTGSIGSIDDIDESLFSRYLLTAKAGNVCDPDLLIRTSGELRLSNFLLYQLAYSEMVFLQKNWPEFTKGDLIETIVEFTRRKRRFGK